MLAAALSSSADIVGSRAFGVGIRRMSSLPDLGSILCPLVGFYGGVVGCRKAARGRIASMCTAGLRRGCATRMASNVSINSTPSAAMLIGGRLVQAEHRKTAPVINPATGDEFASVPEASHDDLDKAVLAARKAFDTWRSKPFVERGQHLKAFADALAARKEEFAVTLTKEQGKPLSAARGEVARVVKTCYDMAEIGDLQPEVIDETSRGRAEEHYAPRGVVAAITPWNFPLAMAANKFAPALITGNTCVLKPSPYTPLTTAMLSEIAIETLPPGVLNILTGGNQLGQWMVEHPDVKHVSFTGSSATGKKIMAAASGTLKKITLELGGNDPAIVLPNSNIKRFAPRLFAAAMFNTGQVCTALKRVYVHDAQYEELVEALAVEARKAKIGDGLEQDTQFGPINNKMQLERVSNLVDEARSQGARVIVGGRRVQPTGKPNGYFYEPTILADVNDNHRIVKEEQFGPALPVLKYADVADAIQRANETDYGLGGSVWGDDAAEAARVSMALECGNIWINTHMSSGTGINAPFGGIKGSGIGRESGGKVGLKEFVDMKVLYIPKS